MNEIKFIAAALLLSLLFACGGVVRDEHVYRQEMRFLAELTKQLSDDQLAQALAAAKAQDRMTCERLAENALLAAIRGPWRFAKMLYLSGLGEDPGPPPTVKTAKEWCEEQRNPLRIGQ